MPIGYLGISALTEKGEKKERPPMNTDERG